MCTVAPVVVAKYRMANMVAKNFFTPTGKGIN